MITKQTAKYLLTLLDGSPESIEARRELSPLAKGKIKKLAELKRAFEHTAKNKSLPLCEANKMLREINKEINILEND